MVCLVSRTDDFEEYVLLLSVVAEDPPLAVLAFLDVVEPRYQGILIAA